MSSCFNIEFKSMDIETIILRCHFNVGFYEKKGGCSFENYTYMASVARKGTFGTFQNFKWVFHKNICISAVRAYFFIKLNTDLLKTLCIVKQVLKGDDSDQQLHHGHSC